MSDPQVRRSVIQDIREGTSVCRRDLVAVEEPLEVRLVHGPEHRRVEASVAVLMRTPGRDLELALGFFRAEGILIEPEQLLGAGPGGDSPACNVVRVELRPGVAFDLDRLQRNFYATSSCGVCSKASLEAIRVTGCSPFKSDDPVVSSELIRELPARLQERQSAFAQTGGLHAAGLFDAAGQLQWIHEDVGRHNAVDKIIGEAFQHRRLPLSREVLLVSGRSSFEILQKALAAGIPIVAAVGAPSSLAVDLAREYRMTLLGFVSQGRFNIYAGEKRITR